MPARIVQDKQSGAIILRSAMPADFMAVNSKSSPILPKEIREESRMANGMAVGTNVMLAYQKNLPSNSIDKPFPIRSST